jgi:glycosyltransferase involved in cell wall biosynthesis
VAKLIVQIPCFNEEKTLAATVADIPRQVPGFDVVEVLVIDDGSSDATVEVARKAGVEHVVRFAQNRGLAAAFAAGLEASLRHGATVIVHTDADNQYRGDCIPALVAPIVAGEADMVVGVRPIEDHPEFSWVKKRLQQLGSRVVRGLSRTSVADVTSGFRAYNREAALRLTVLSDFTYTHETLIQAGRTGLAVAQVPIQVNRKTRPSRLFKGMGQYITRSLGTMLRIYAVYQPLKLFATLGAALFGAGVVLGLRYLILARLGQGTGHVQSVMLAGVLMILGFQAVMLGLLADLIGANRKLLQDVVYRVRRLETAGSAEDGGNSDG